VVCPNGYEWTCDVSRVVELSLENRTMPDALLALFAGKGMFCGKFRKQKRGNFEMKKNEQEVTVRTNACR
jgi:hypothetical protein